MNGSVFDGEKKEGMIRTAPDSRSGGTTQDIRRDFSQEQLAAIGAVALAFNEVEFMVDVSIYSGEALAADCLVEDLPKAMLDQKISRLRKAKNRWQLSERSLTLIERSIDVFGYLKDLRNAVIHSRLFDASSAIGERITRKSETQQVLLTEAALGWLYQQLVVLRGEMRCVLAIFDLVRSTETAVQQGLIQQDRTDVGPEVEEWCSRLVQGHRDRKNLGKAPDFPSS